MKPEKVASSPERHDRFTTVFDEAIPADSDVWEIVDGRKPPAFVENTARWVEDRGKDEKVPTYGTFITVRVEAGGIPFGALTVNAIKPGSLLREDRLFVEAIARLLGIAELLCLTHPAYQKARAATASRAAVSGQPSTQWTRQREAQDDRSVGCRRRYVYRGAGRRPQGRCPEVASGDRGRSRE